MYAPLVGKREYVELYNNATNTAFDLSGWEFHGLGYTFPAGSLLAATITWCWRPTGGLPGRLRRDQYRCLTCSAARCRPTARRYLNAASNVVVAKVRYANQAPWPTNANGGRLAAIDGLPAGQLAGGQLGQAVLDRIRPARPSGRMTRATGTAPRPDVHLLADRRGRRLYIDDIKMVAGSVAGAGVNMMTDGDFESAFPGPWTLSANLVNSALSTAVKHSGTASLHLISTGGGDTSKPAPFGKPCPQR